MYFEVTALQHDSAYEYVFGGHGRCSIFNSCLVYISPDDKHFLAAGPTDELRGVVETLHSRVAMDARDFAAACGSDGVDDEDYFEDYEEEDEDEEGFVLKTIKVKVEEPKKTGSVMLPEPKVWITFECHSDRAMDGQTMDQAIRQEFWVIDQLFGSQSLALASYLQNQALAPGS